MTSYRTPDADAEMASLRKENDDLREELADALREIDNLAGVAAENAQLRKKVGSLELRLLNTSVKEVRRHS